MAVCDISLLSIKTPTTESANQVTKDQRDERLANFRRRAESRLHAYASENAEATTDSIIKTIEDLRQTAAITEGLLRELVQAHGLPDELGVVPDEYRKDFRDLLTGSS